MCYISMYLSQQALQIKLMESFYQNNFKFVFEFLAENRNFFKRIAKREYWSTCNVLYINGLVSTSYLNKWKAFLKFQISIRNFGQKQIILAENRKIFKRIARHEYWFNYNVLYINGFVLTSSINWRKAVFYFQISFRNFGRKLKNIETNREACILIKLQCVIYQWIRLNNLYKLLESFFHISISFLNYWLETEKYSNRVNIDRSAMYYISMDLTRQALQHGFLYYTRTGFMPFATLKIRPYYFIWL